MRVLHLSWEYPPLVYGGLGRHVHALAEAQAARGDDVSVITAAVAGAPADSTINGVRVIRVEHDPPEVPFDQDHLLAWVMGLESAMVRAGLPLGPLDVVHGHDWIVAHAAINLRDAHDCGLVTTIHATEAGRHQGWLPAPLSQAIHSTEHWLVHSSDQVIVCSEHMRREVQTLFAPLGETLEHISVIANGIDLRRWRASAQATAIARDRYAADGPLIVFVGRLEWEKGAHTLIDALPRLRRRLPGLRVVIAGRGSASADLVRRTRERRVSPMVEFAGWLPERELHALIAAADALVIPSLYEPFGLVALEGAALGSPLVVADTGGLSEFVIDGTTGSTFTPGDPAELAHVLTGCINDAAGSRSMAARARTRLRDSYGWEFLATHTDAVYRRARGQGRSRTLTTAHAPAPGVNLLRA